MLLIGIDPGKSGGIAWCSQRSSVAAVAMPATEGDLWNLVNHLGSYSDGARALLEKLGAMPRDKETGRAKQSPTTMLTMGQNYGLIRMALVAAGIAFDEILPRQWQQQLGLMGGTKNRTEKKNRHKQRAQNLHPNLKVTHATADALLILEVLRRREWF